MIFLIHRIVCFFIIGMVIFLCPSGLLALQTVPDLPAASTGHELTHGAKGFELVTADRKHLLQIAGRLQFRFATPNDQDPLTFDDFGQATRNIFKINRARLKIGGYSYQPWLKYYFEYEIGASRLLDFRVMVEKWPWLSFKLGQWKSEYSRERVISSGKQQMMERSIINRPFTLDRQQGISIYGHLEGRGLADFNYNLMILTGNGLNTSINDDENLMYSGRLQWNFLGEGVAMSGSDLEFHEKPTASLAWAGALNTSQFTRFSSVGGGNLNGFEEGAAGQYSIKQYLLESAFKYKGFSLHSEYHRKNILNNQQGNQTLLVGWFGQGGYIINAAAAENSDRPLYEIAARYASFTPDASLPMNYEEEFSLAFNCFFKAHLNKLTADVTVFDFDEGSINREASGWRFRIQYDFSF